MDGYPDLLVTTSQRVILLQSILCNSKMCTDKATELGRRTFSVVRAGSDALEKVVHPRQAAFFDIDEDVSGTRL